MVYTSFETPPHLIAPAQVLEGALFHYYCGTEGDLRLAHLLVDNVVELLTVGYFRDRARRKTPDNQNDRIRTICEERGLSERIKRTLLDCHRDRNRFYHEIVAGAPAQNAVYQYIWAAVAFAEAILGRDYDDFEFYTLHLGFLIAVFKLETALRQKGHRKRPVIRFVAIQGLPEHDQIDRLLDSEDELYPVTVDQLEVVTNCLSQLLTANRVNEFELEWAWEAAIQLRTSLEGISYELA